MCYYIASEASSVAYPRSASRQPRPASADRALGSIHIYVIYIYIYMYIYT